MSIGVFYTCVFAQIDIHGVDFYKLIRLKRVFSGPQTADKQDRNPRFFIFVFER